MSLKGSERVVAKFVIASRALLREGAALSIGCLNGVRARGDLNVQGRCVLAVMIECTQEGSISRVFAISNPENLGAIGSPS